MKRPEYFLIRLACALRPTVSWVAVLGLSLLSIAQAPAAPSAVKSVPGFAQPWNRHTIDDSSRGADGVRLADVNGDGLPDIATGWEEGGRVRLCLNPGPARVRSKWPAVTVGQAGSVEDAVITDLDGNGVQDVVSSCEGNVKTMYVHWAPGAKEDFLKPAAWRTGALPASVGVMRWMFCAPLEVDGRNGIDLVAGGKDAGAHIGWFESPPDPKQLADWKWHPLCPAGWIMSLVTADMDGDGDLDILATDRKGESRGCFWLENPGLPLAPTAPWKRHPIGGAGREVMFLVVVDLDRDGLPDVLVATKPRDILFFRRLNRDGRQWESHRIQMPPIAGTAKGVAVGDINLDAQPDIVFTCEGATDARSGVMWLSCVATPTNGDWEAHEISDAEGIKYDLVELLDLDGDGDLDVLTCEEARNLGVFWYENPTRSRGHTPP